MGVLTIGRVTLEEGSAPDPGMTWDGDELTFSGVAKASTADAAKALKAQLVGLADNTDEPVVPVTWADSTDIDGFYRVRSVNVVAIGASYTAFWFPFEVQLERLAGGWQAPLVEVICRGADRSTGHTVTEWSWVGGLLNNDFNAVQFYGLTNINGASSNGIETAEGGQVSFFFGNTANKDDLYDTEMVYQVDPADFYSAAARIETSPDSGTNWYTVTGRQVNNTPLYWRLYNGLIRVTQGTASRFDIEAWDDGAGDWKTAKTFQLSEDGAKDDLFGAPDTITVLRNSPEVVSIRLWYSTGAGVQDARSLDLTVARGAWWLTGVVSVPESSYTAQVGVWLDTLEAATAVTAGADAAAADGDGDKYQLRSSSTVSVDTTNGGIYLSSAANSFPFAIGFDLNEAAAVTTTNAYFAAMAHRQQVGAR